VRTEEYAIAQHARRIELATSTLYAIEAKILSDVHTGGSGLNIEHAVANAVAIYCAHLVAESQK
jgi:hypothetical protein